MNESRLRKQVHKQAKRKRKRWAKALQAVDGPISLIFAVDRDHPTPLPFLPLPKVKQRIKELNVLWACSRAPGDGGPDSSTPEAPADGRAIASPAPPPVLRDKSLIDLEQFNGRYAQGQVAYSILVQRGNIQPAPGRDWSVVTRACLARVLPGVNLNHGRRRIWYIVQVERDQDDRIVSVKVWSPTWRPMFERRIQRASATSTS